MYEFALSHSMPVESCEAYQISIVYAAATRCLLLRAVFDGTGLPAPAFGPANAVTSDELRETVSKYWETVSKYWIVDEVKLAQIHNNLPEGFAVFPGVELRGEPTGRKSRELH